MDLLRDVEGQDVAERIRPEVLRGGQEPEDHLETEQQQRDHEVRIGDPLRVVPHGKRPLTSG